MAFDIGAFNQAAALIERARLVYTRLQAAKAAGYVRIDNNPDLDTPFTQGWENLWTQKALDLLNQGKALLATLV